MDPAKTTEAGEMSILFQAIAVLDGGKLTNAWFIIHLTPDSVLEVCETFNGTQSAIHQEGYGSNLLGINSVFVRSSLYVIGGRVPNDFVLSNRISWLDTGNLSKGWETGNLPSACVDSIIGVYGDYLYILPGVWKYGYHHVDEDTYLTEREGHIWNTIDNKLHETKILPPIVGGKRQWRRIRACAALDGQGLLIAMDGEKNNFFLHIPGKKEWEICEFKDPLPKFTGETSFAASKGRLYILDVPSSSPACLFIYDTNERKLLTKQSIDDLRSMDERDRVVRLVPVADDKLCFLWLGPAPSENENMWPPVRILHCLKIEFSTCPNPTIKDVDSTCFRTNITDLLDCHPGERCQDNVEDITSPEASPDAKGNRTQHVDFPPKTEFPHPRDCKVETNSRQESVDGLEVEPATLKFELDAVTISSEGQISLGKRAYSLNTAKVPPSVTFGPCSGSINGLSRINIGPGAGGYNNNKGAGAGANRRAGSGGYNTGNHSGSIDFQLGSFSIKFGDDWFPDSESQI